MKKSLLSPFVCVALPLMAVLVMSVACMSGKNKASAEVVECFPLPHVPDSVVNPDERASIVASRFWDDAVFAPGVDTVTPALEQAMADFVAIAAIASNPDSVGRGIEVLLNNGGEALIMPLAQLYLHDFDSPVRSDDLFIMFLERAPHWCRSDALLEQVLKNRTGTRAADFSFTDSRGRSGSLAEFVEAAGETVVYFFDSECKVCKESVPMVEAYAAGRPVLAVCPRAYAADFDRMVQHFPKPWTVVRDSGEIEANDLYIFNLLPSVYVISADMIVNGKDISL